MLTSHLLSGIQSTSEKEAARSKGFWFHTLKLLASDCLFHIHKYIPYSCRRAASLIRQVLGALGVGVRTGGSVGVAAGAGAGASAGAVEAGA